MNPHRSRFEGRRLIRVTGAEVYQSSFERPLRIGDIVMLNSGGPRMMVVDIAENALIAGWREATGEVQEASFAAACVHRISPL